MFPELSTLISTYFPARKTKESNFISKNHCPCCNQHRRRYRHRHRSRHHSSSASSLARVVPMSWTHHWVAFVDMYTSNICHFGDEIFAKTYVPSGEVFVDALWRRNKTKSRDSILKQAIAIPLSATSIVTSGEFKPRSAPAIYGLPFHLSTLRNLR